MMEPTKAEFEARARGVMNRMNEMGVPRCEATEEVVARVLIHPHGRIYVRFHDGNMTLLGRTWEKDEP